MWHLKYFTYIFQRATLQNLLSEMKWNISHLKALALNYKTVLPFINFKLQSRNIQKKNKYSAAKPCFLTLNLIFSITKTWFNKRRHGFVAWSFLNRMTWVPKLSSNQILKSNSLNFGYKSVFWEKHSSQQINFL